MIGIETSVRFYITIILLLIHYPELILSPIFYCLIYLIIEIVIIY